MISAKKPSHATVPLRRFRFCRFYIDCTFTIKKTFFPHHKRITMQCTCIKKGHNPPPQLEVDTGGKWSLNSCRTHERIEKYFHTDQTPWFL